MADSFFPFVPDAIALAFEDEDPTIDAKCHERIQVQSIQRQVQAIGVGDVGSYLREIHDDVEMEIHCPDIFPFIRRARGIDAVRNAIAANFAMIENQQPQIVSVVAQGNIIDIVIQETGRIRATQVDYDGMALQQFVFRAGKVSKFREIIALRSP